MQSHIAETIKLKFHPVGVIWTDTKADNAIQIKKNKWVCIMSMVAQTATAFMLPYQEENSDQPKAMVGLLDLYARKTVRKMIGDNFLSFTIPYKMFLNMQKDVAESSLAKSSWEEARDWFD